MQKLSVALVGGGLAGCECALRLARSGHDVVLFEQKPLHRSPAHVNDNLAELVCSNSLRSDELTSGVGLLKAEMRALGSRFMEAADACRVPAGKALAVDREAFARQMSQLVESEANIRLVRHQVQSLDDAVLEPFRGEGRAIVVAAGPMANLLLAVVLFWTLFVSGTDEPKPVLGKPFVGSPAELAGIQNGEQVLKLAGEPVRTWQEMRWSLLRSAVDQDAVELEVINERNEVAIRRLDVNAAKADGWQGDALEKLGLTVFRPTIPPVIGSVIPGSPADDAGLRQGDVIVQIADTVVTTWTDVVRRVRESPEVSISLLVERNGERLSVTVTPERTFERGIVFGRIGASVDDSGVDLDAMLVRVSYGPVISLNKAVSETWDKSVFSLRMIGKMITGDISLRNISGPVTIADYAGQSAKLGLDYYLKFLALVSISLAVLNLLPVPILDGGHLLYYVLEIIRRKPLSDRAMEIGQQVGMALMLMLMALAFYNDVNRLISG